MQWFRIKNRTQLNLSFIRKEGKEFVLDLWKYFKREKKKHPCRSAPVKGFQVIGENHGVSNDSGEEILEDEVLWGKLSWKISRKSTAEK